MAQRERFGITVTLARMARKRGNWSAAARYFQRAAESASTDAVLWYEAAKAIQFSGGEGAERAYAASVASPDAPSDAWYRFGRILEKKGEFEPALHAFQEAEEKGGAIGHLSFRQARCLEALGEIVAASVKFRRAAVNGFDPKQCFLELERLQSPDAPNWLQLDLYREGQEFFDSQDVWTLNHARLAAHMCFFPEAIKFFAVASTSAALDESNLLLFARALEATGRFREEEEVLGRALSKLSAEERLLGVGVVFQRAAMWTRARKEYLQKWQSDRKNPELQYRIGLTFDREYKWSEAAEWFERAFRHSFDSNVDSAVAGQWAYKCGHAYERLRQPTTAVGWYRAALKIEPNRKHWWYRMGCCLAQLGDLSNAYSALLKSTGRDTVPRNLDSGVNSEESEENAIELEVGPPNVADWVSQALTDGEWVLRKPAGLLELAEFAATRGLEEGRVALLKKATEHGFSLASEDRVDLAISLDEVGEPAAAVELLLDSREVRLPDGVDLKKYLPSNRSRSSRLYAEFWENRPVEDSIVLFESNHGSSIGCHPLAIFEQMLDDPRFEGRRFVWAVNNSSKAPRAVQECSRVQFVSVGSDEYLALLATAGFLINNVSFPPYFTRRPEQRYLNTWHGTPIKTLGRSMKQGLVEYENLERNFLQASHLMAPNKLTKWALLDEHHLGGIYPGSVDVLGSPRLDALVRDGERLRREVRKRLEVSSQERMVLVAPTWRGGVSLHDLDIDVLVAELRALADLEGVRVFYRAHRLTEKLVRDLDLPVEVVPQDIDTNVLLAGVDHLVSDYSSIVIDFLVTGRPITLYVPDRSEYESARGLYLPLEELPVGLASSIEDLVDDVDRGGDINKDDYAAAVEEYCPFEDGAAAARCIDFFLSDDKRGSELNGQRTVLFHASLIPNGIASALLAILEELIQSGVNVLLIVEPMVLRVEEDRAETFKRIPDGVRLISRLGDTLMTPEEFYVRNVVESGRCEPGLDMLDKYRSSWSKEARRIVGDIPVDVAIEWDGYATLWAGLVSAIGDEHTRHLIWQHNQMRQEQEHKYPELAALFRMYPWFDEVVSVSQQLAEQNYSDLAPLGVLPSSGVKSVPNALLFDTILERAAAPILPEHESYFEASGPVVITVGRLSMEKNHTALISAWPRVLIEHPNAKLLLVGSGPLESQLATQIEQLGLQQSVYLIGQVSNPYPLMRRANLFVLPSLHEGQPVVLFETMALGVPIGASGCPGNLEAMEQGYGTLLPTSAEKLGEALDAILTGNEGADGVFDASLYSEKALSRFRAVSGLISL